MRYTKNVLNAVLGIGALSVFMIGGVFSYFTDNEIVTNVVTVGDVIVDLVVDIEKESADFYKIEFISPNVDIKIETYAINSGTEDIVVFMEVLIPAKDNLICVSDTGVPILRKKRAIYDFLGRNEDEDEGKWVFIENRYYAGSGYDPDASPGEWKADLFDYNAKYIGYVFGYNEKLLKGIKTEPLFEGLKPANFTEQSTSLWQWHKLPVTIRVYAIQSGLFEGASSVSTVDSSTEPVDVDNLGKNDLRYILYTFTNQNYEVSINGGYKDADTNGKLHLDSSPIN